MLVRIASREDTDQIAVGLGLLRGNKCLKLPWVKISYLNCPGGIMMMMMMLV